jgi:hypothetical protein
MKYIAFLLCLALFVGAFHPARAQGSTIALVQHSYKDAGTAAAATRSCISLTLRVTTHFSLFLLFSRGKTDGRSALRSGELSIV